MVCTDSGSAYSYQVQSFSVVYAEHVSGTDTAYLYDNTGSVFIGQQDNSVLYGTGYYDCLAGFQVVITAMSSASDTAFLYDTSGNNTFERHTASGGQLAYSVFYGANFYIQVTGSLEVTVTAASPTDQAYVDDNTIDSRLYATPTATTLTNTAATHFNFLLNYFVNVQIIETSSHETAYMYDSTGGDRFYGTPTESVMAGLDYSIVADGFSTVYAFSAGGGNDYAYMYDAKNNGTFYGYDTQSVMQGSYYYYEAVGFRYAFGLSAGGDTAFLSDAAGSASLDAHQAYSVLYGSTFYNLASNFKTVNVTGNGSRGSDTAFLNDSAGNDEFLAASDDAQLAYPSNVVNIAAFANVLGRSTLGGSDTKSLQAVDYNLALTGNWI
jgi:hypothetical protein